MTKHAHRQAKYAKKHLTPSGMPPLRTKRIYVDVENDFGTSNLATLERDELYAGGRELLEDAGFSYGDQVHVAASHYNVVAAHQAFPHARVHMRSGVDGADRALVDAAELDLAHLERISEVVIASGDNYFVDTVRKFTDHHIPVTVIAHARGLSSELRHVAPTLVLLRHGFGAWRFQE